MSQAAFTTSGKTEGAPAAWPPEAVAKVREIQTLLLQPSFDAQVYRRIHGLARSIAESASFLSKPAGAVAAAASAAATHADRKQDHLLRSHAQVLVLALEESLATRRASAKRPRNFSRS